MFDSFEAECLWWRRRCGWGLETAESGQTCPIPTLASNKLLVINVLQVEHGGFQQISFWAITQ
jgi:hypothetical protein